MLTYPEVPRSVNRHIHTLLLSNQRPKKAMTYKGGQQSANQILWVQVVEFQSEKPPAAAPKLVYIVNSMNGPIKPASSFIDVVKILCTNTPTKPLFLNKFWKGTCQTAGFSSKRHPRRRKTSPSDFIVNSRELQTLLNVIFRMEVGASDSSTKW